MSRMSLLHLPDSRDPSMPASTHRGKRSANEGLFPTSRLVDIGIERWATGLDTRNAATMIPEREGTTR